jgi:hypothetical protein
MIAHLSPRHCEERSDEAIQGNRRYPAVALDRRAAKRRLAMTAGRA